MPEIKINVHIPSELDKLIHAAIAEKLAEMQELVRASIPRLARQ